MFIGDISFRYAAVSIFFRRIKKASSVTVLFRTQGNEPVVFSDTVKKA
jgi:hypothetical protein